MQTFSVQGGLAFVGWSVTCDIYVSTDGRTDEKRFLRASLDSESVNMCNVVEGELCNEAKISRDASGEACMVRRSLRLNERPWILL